MYVLFQRVDVVVLLREAGCILVHRNGDARSVLTTPEGSHADGAPLMWGLRAHQSMSPVPLRFAQRRFLLVRGNRRDFVPHK